MDQSKCTLDEFPSKVLKDKAQYNLFRYRHTHENELLSSIEICSGEDLTEEFLQQRLYPNKSLTRLRFALPNGPEKRKHSPNRNSPDILRRPPYCDRRKSSMTKSVDVTTKGPEKRNPSPYRSSPDILIRPDILYEGRNTSMPRLVDVSNIATGS